MATKKQTTAEETAALENQVVETTQMDAISDIPVQSISLNLPAEEGENKYPGNNTRAFRQ
jgi:hypothetical protein